MPARDSTTQSLSLQDELVVLTITTFYMFFFFFLAHTFVSFISTMSHGLKLWITRNFHVEIEHVDEEPKNDFSEFTRRFFKNKKRL